MELAKKSTTTRARRLGRRGGLGLAVGLLSAIFVVFASAGAADAQTSLPADIVFLIDESGSMGGEINAVEANVNTIATALESASLDPRFALVEFGGQGLANPGLTTDLTDAAGLSTALATLFPSGSREPGFDSIVLARNQVSFRPGAGVCYVLISDEDSNGDFNATKQDAIDAINDQGAGFFGIVGTGGFIADDYGPNAGSVSAETGGQVFNINGFSSNPQPVLDALLAGCIGSILEGINLTPPTATNPVGTDHTVTAIVSDNTGTRLPGVMVDFEVTSGPNAGTTDTGTTDSNGEATFTYNGSGGPGTDVIEATFTDSSGAQRSATAEKIWEGGPVVGTCDDAIISDYSGTGDTVDVTNVSNNPIDLSTCSLVAYDVFSETSVGGTQLSGTLDAAATSTVSVPNMPDGPGAVGIYDGAPPANGSPFVTTGDITGMVYLSDAVVFGVGHLRVPAYNAIYDCIYGGSGTGPWFARNPVGGCLP